jgi:hypothetical protein
VKQWHRRHRAPTLQRQSWFQNPVPLSAADGGYGDFPGTHTAVPILISKSGATGETKKAAQRFSAIRR